VRNIENGDIHKDLTNIRKIVGGEGGGEGDYTVWDRKKCIVSLSLFYLPSLYGTPSMVNVV